MFFHVIASSAIGQALLAGEAVESAFPGHDPDRFSDRTVAINQCPDTWLVVKAEMNPQAQRKRRPALPDPARAPLPRLDPERVPVSEMKRGDSAAIQLGGLGQSDTLAYGRFLRYEGGLACVVLPGGALVTGGSVWVRPILPSEERLLRFWEDDARRRGQWYGGEFSVEDAAQSPAGGV